MGSLTHGLRLGFALLIGVFLSLAARPADAQQLQNGKPIRLIVALAAGGGTDVTARLIAQQMTQNMGTTVLVENKPGGNFIPAGKRSPGFTARRPHALFHFVEFAHHPGRCTPDYPFDLMKFAAVSEVATGPLIIVVRNGLGVKSMKRTDRARQAEARQALKFGAGGGFGSSLGFGTALLKTLTDINITIVPYRGAGPALNDLLGGHIDAMVDAMPVMVGAGQGGQGDAARGDQHQARLRPARRADHAGTGLQGFRRPRLVRHPCSRPARPLPSCRS